jgi:hypothetical protein
MVGVEPIADLFRHFVILGVRDCLAVTFGDLRIFSLNGEILGLQRLFMCLAPLTNEGTCRGCLAFRSSWTFFWTSGRRLQARARRPWRDKQRRRGLTLVPGAGRPFRIQVSRWILQLEPKRRDRRLFLAGVGRSLALSNVTHFSHIFPTQFWVVTKEMATTTAALS